MKLKLHHVPNPDIPGGVLTNQGWRYDSWLGFPLFEDASYWRPLSSGVPAEDCKGMER